MSIIPELELFKKYGNRTSSLISMYPHFSSFSTPESEGELRFFEKKSIVAVSNEPLAAIEKRKKLLLDFFNCPRFKSKDKLAFPLSEKLALELQDEGLHVWQVGSEPIFDLNHYFSNPTTIFKNFPSAMSLKRRGGKIVEIKGDEVENHKELLTELSEEWMGRKKLAPLVFLNVVEPLTHQGVKRYFLLKDRQRVSAALTACPIYENETVVGYFFNDILKVTNSKNATTELIILEAMRLLYEEGIKEVRLGMSPLALLSNETKDYKKLRWIYGKLKVGYNFQSLYFFKNKMKPTSWQPLYLASNKPGFFRMISNVIRLHMSPGFISDFCKRNWYSSRHSLALREKLSKYKLPAPRKLSFNSILFRIKWTLTLMFLFIGIDLFKTMSSSGHELFLQSGFLIGHVTWKGLFVAPFFHNHSFHLFGDQLSFLIFGGAIEYVFGANLFFLLTAIGLWLSNPVTHLLLFSFLKPFSLPLWEKVLVEIDYGSSNAVFALVGACFYVLKKRGWLLWPFLFYAIYICLQRESFLALHHFVAILLGVFFAGLYFAFKRSNKNCNT